MAGTLVLGVFDGVHIGHRALLREAKAAGSGPLTAVSFSPHPAEVLHPGFRLLTLEAERKELLLAAGADAVVFLPFEEIISMPPLDYLAYLKKRFSPGLLAAGFNHTFGAQGAGTAKDLGDFARQNGLRAFIMPPFAAGGVVSSSAVRQALLSGRPEEAAQMLGRPYTLVGEVVKGFQRGAKLGYPTANVAAPARRLWPMPGVYITKTTVGGQTSPSITNIGSSPTFGENAATCETHLLEGGRDLYGLQAKVAFVKYIRPEKRFAGVDALIAQMRQDAEIARAYFFVEDKKKSAPKNGMGKLFS